MARIVFYVGALFVGNLLMATPVAVIDSGTDFQHRYLKDNLLEPKDQAANEFDDDGNGYVDDTYGWNFAEKTHKQVAYEGIPGEFADYVRALNILMALNSGINLSEADMGWIREKWSGADGYRFRSNVGLAAQFSHGTHVAGITLRESSFSAEIMALQIMATVSFIPEGTNPDVDGTPGANSTKNEGGQPAADNDNSNVEEVTDEDFIALFKSLAKENNDSWLKEIELLTYRQIRAANCSFGFGFKQAVQLVSGICAMNRVKCDDPRLDRLARYFLEYYKRPDSARMISTNDQIIFVIAAGNDAGDNDVFPDEPGNYEAENRITVAATNIDNSAIASFSNYGKTTVDVAAPGEIIKSSYPQDLMGKMSGTSQAAPYVTGVVAKIIDINPKLTALEVKTIVMKTVDKKDWLAEKVLAGGVVNKLRAFKAAELSLQMDLDDAIMHANLEIEAMKYEPERSRKLTFKNSLLYTQDMRDFTKSIIQNLRPNH